jgi:hypothetical protein
MDKFRVHRLVQKAAERVEREMAESEEPPRLPSTPLLPPSLGKANQDADGLEASSTGDEMDVSTLLDRLADDGKPQSLTGPQMPRRALSKKLVNAANGFSNLAERIAAPFVRLSGTL